MRKKIIAGNWKMNIKPSETAALVKGIAEATQAFGNVDIVCCTPAIDVPAAVAAAAGTAVQVGAENAHWEASGAYTGDISTGMLGAVIVTVTGYQFDNGQKWEIPEEDRIPTMKAYSELWGRVTPTPMPPENPDTNGEDPNG